MAKPSRHLSACSKSAKLVDEVGGIAYLLPTMIRRFLAFVALLTGLVAFGGPVQASLVEALACESSIAATTGDECTSGRSVAVQSVPTTVHESRDIEAPQSRPARPRALRLPVLMGIERAYE
jgi:hypothetical protein